jgi:hypothetical protein
MIMTPGLRKFALTTHVTASVGWLGAVGAFLALAIVGRSSQDPQTVRAAYLALPAITWFVIVPLTLAALLTGIVQSLGTTWGLFRHYWIVTKLLLTVLATILLLVHTQLIDRVATRAAEATLSTGDLRQSRMELVAKAGAALLVLLVVTTLSVYKPWGMTPYGLRKQNEGTAASRAITIQQTGPWGPVRAVRDHRSRSGGAPRASRRRWHAWPLITLRVR